MRLASEDQTLPASLMVVCSHQFCWWVLERLQRQKVVQMALLAIFRGLHSSHVIPVKKQAAFLLQAALQSPRQEDH